ncbi:MAG: PH domain-containing protein [Gordonia sp. (in: high G+C Gram-positive bacteria)]|uniref:PH domain-containing protein n=1 Tax=Gordonia sp. (in: high G+C Gram-positive bacteria) TaxID=84139 RepID=UPI0039E721D7
MTGDLSGHPAELEQTPPEWVYTYRPEAIRTIASVVAAVVVAIHLVFGLLLGISYTGVNVGWLDKSALIVQGLIIAAAVLLFTRSRLRVGPQGVGVLNLVSERIYGWDVVQGLSYPDKAQWARLLFPQDEHIPVMAVQARDGDRAVEAMREFRELQERYSGRSTDS